MNSNRGLTPKKVMALYLIVFGLVCFHEMDRIAGWFENICLEWDASAPVLDFCYRTKSLGERIGVTRLVTAEKDLSDLANDLPELGEIKDKTSPVFPPRPGLKTARKTNPAPPPAPGGPETNSGSGPSNNAPGLPGDKKGPGPTNLVNNPGPETTRIDAPVPNGPSGPPSQPPGPDQPVAPGSTPIEPPANIANIPVKIRPQKILIAGDSMILEGFGVALERKLKKYDGLEIIREGKYSSGLSRPDYYDWNASLKEKLEKHQPDLLIVSLGANDPQDILDENKKRYHVATEGWNKVYSERAKHFLEIAQEKGVPTIWVGLPIMGHKKYGQRIANINTLVAEQCAEVPNCHFVDVWLTLADDNENYTTFITNQKGGHIRIRAKDQVHLTEAGGEIMVTDFLEKACGYIDLPEKHLQQAESRTLLKSPGRHSGVN